ncbi:MAG: glycosyltransferase family 9 protein [Pseudomonadota bacterium]
MKILFITSTRIGDAVLSTGALNYLIQKHKGCEVSVVCGPLPATLFEGFPNIDEIIALKKEKHHKHWFKLWKKVSKTKWDIVVDFRNSLVSRTIFAKKRYIYGKQIDQKKHKVEQASHLIERKLDIPAPKLYFTAEQEQFADELLGSHGKFIAVGPTANWIGKTWESEKFIETIEWLTRDEGPFPDMPVAIFAAPGEEEQAHKVFDALPEDKRIDVIAKGNPGQVAAILNCAEFYLGNDSGLMHIAAACQVPTVGVFGPSYPHLYAPWGIHTAYAQTPETFDELTDFEGYDPKTLDRTLMKSLKTETLFNIIYDFLTEYESHRSSQSSKTA